MNYQTISVEKKENYSIITLNRPDKLNALNATLLEELYSAVNAIKEDADIRAVIITGAGPKAFAAGADIAQLHTCDTATGAIFAGKGQEVFTSIEKLGKPVIAAVNGFALGGGCELALACHIRYCSENAKFGQPEVNLGIIPGYGGTQRLTRLVGTAKSAELILSGNIIGADEARTIGLVNAVFSQEHLMEETEKFVKTVVSKAPLAVNAALDCIIAVVDMTEQEGMEFEAKTFGTICGTDDFYEGTKAFLEKRPAVFQGK